MTALHPHVDSDKEVNLGDFLKTSRRQNSITSSRTDGGVRVWQFSEVLCNDSRPHLQDVADSLFVTPWRGRQPESFLFDTRYGLKRNQFLISLKIVEEKWRCLTTIQINQPANCNSFTSLLLDVYVRLNMFWAPLRPSSGAYNCTRSLWFYRWSVAGGAVWGVVWQDPNHKPPNPTPPPAPLQR
jgi:hypothetical protein